jgi:hypothetical protein
LATTDTEGGATPTPGASAEAADGAPPRRKRRRGGRGRRRGGQGRPEGASGEPGLGAPAEGAAAQAAEGGAAPQARRPRRPREPRPQREPGPLPFPQLRAAADSILKSFGGRRALRDAFSVLGDRERADLAKLIAEDGDWRVRARKIAAGSLGAGRLGKALGAQQISMAEVEDLWPIVLSKEEAAARQARVRDARQRDERRARRQAERRSSGDRVSRDELAKAQDGRVGANVRIVIEGEKRGRKGKGEERPGTTDDLLSRLGY